MRFSHTSANLLDSKTSLVEIHLAGDLYTDGDHEL